MQAIVFGSPGHTRWTPSDLWWRVKGTSNAVPIVQCACCIPFSLFFASFFLHYHRHNYVNQLIQLINRFSFLIHFSSRPPPTRNRITFTNGLVIIACITSTARPKRIRTMRRAASSSLMSAGCCVANIRPWSKKAVNSIWTIWWPIRWYDSSASKSSSSNKVESS